MIGLVPALLGAAAAQWLDPAEPEQRRAVEAVLDQLLAEDGNVHHFRDYRQHDHVGINSRSRASDTHGLCRYDSLSIERDPGVRARPEGGGGIREIEATRWFLVLTDDQEKPLWNVSGDELERRCAQVSTSMDRWFVAEHGYEAKAAVQALTALKEELLKPDPRPGMWSCRRESHCPDPKAVASLIRPLDPGEVTSGESSVDPCPDNRWCLTVQLADPGCGAWVTQLRMDRRNDDRFVAARVSWLAGMLECGEREMLEP